VCHLHRRPLLRRADVGLGARPRSIRRRVRTGGDVVSCRGGRRPSASPISTRNPRCTPPRIRSAGDSNSRLGHLLYIEDLAEGMEAFYGDDEPEFQGN
jgi:hypothetical protein